MGWICKESEVMDVFLAGSKRSRGKRVGFLRRAHLRDSSGASKSSFDCRNASAGNRLPPCSPFLLIGQRVES